MERPLTDPDLRKTTISGLNDHILWYSWPAMIQSIVMLDPADGSLNSLARAFRDVLGETCVVHTVMSAAEMEASLRSAFPYTWRWSMRSMATDRFKGLRSSAACGRPTRSCP